MKKLTRHLRHDNNAKHSHFFNATNNHNSGKNYHSNTDETSNANRKMESISITILSSENFTNVVFDSHRVSEPKKDALKREKAKIGFHKKKSLRKLILFLSFNSFSQSVAVLFTSSQCAFCTIFSSVLLTIQRILGDADYVKLARIDSDKNDLPWQYTMETVPAFIIFKK